MDSILKLIKDHQKLINAPGPRNQQYINDLVLAAQMELHEMMDELPWKPWKSAEDQPARYPAAAEELADAFIFLFDIWFQLDVDVPLKQLIIDKIIFNIKRLRPETHSNRRHRPMKGGVHTHTRDL